MSDADFFKALTVGPDTGVANLVKVSGAPLDQLLGGRALSMYADHYPGLTGASADIQFPSWNLRDIFKWYDGTDKVITTAMAFPLIPRPLTFGTPATTSPVMLPGGGAIWYEISGTQTKPQLVRLEGTPGGTMSPSIRLAIARLQ